MPGAFISEPRIALGPLLGALGVLLGALGALLGRSWALLEALLGASWHLPWNPPLFDLGMVVFIDAWLGKVL